MRNFFKNPKELQRVRGRVKNFIKPPKNSWYISDAQKEPKAIFVFGDNDIRKGERGQAIIRGEPNAFGIPTKKLPSNSLNAYYTNKDFTRVKNVYDKKFDELKKLLDRGFTIYLPKDGLGTGLADLKNQASDIWKYLLEKVAELKAYASPIKIISGGQSGIDMYGLKVAEYMGLPTGGMLPKGYLWIPTGRTKKDKTSHTQEIIEKFRLEAHPTSVGWTERTKTNVKKSDMTLLFNYGSNLSLGSKLVQKTVAKEPGKNLKIYNIKGINGDQTKMKAMVSQIVKDLRQYKPRVLNIAGNRLDKEAYVADGGKKKEAITQWFPMILKQALTIYVASASPRQVTTRAPKQVTAPRQAIIPKSVPPTSISPSTYPIVLEGRITDTPNSLVFLFIDNIGQLENYNIILQISERLDLDDLISDWENKTLTKGTQYGENIKVALVSNQFADAGSFVVFDVIGHGWAENHRFVLMFTNTIDNNDNIARLTRIQETEAQKKISKGIKLCQSRSSADKYPNLILSLENIRHIGILDSKRDLYQIIADSTPSQRTIYVYKAYQSLGTVGGYPLIKPKTVEDSIGGDSFSFIKRDDYSVNRSPRTLRDEIDHNLIFIELFPGGKKINEAEFTSRTIDKNLLEIFPYLGNAEIMRQYSNSRGTTEYTNFQNLLRENVFGKILKDVVSKPEWQGDNWSLVRFYKSHQESKKYKDNKITDYLGNPKQRSQAKLTKKLVNLTSPLQPSSDAFSEPTYFLNMPILSTPSNQLITLPNLYKERDKASGLIGEDTIDVPLLTFPIERFVQVLTDFTKSGAFKKLPIKETTFILNLTSWYFTEDEISNLMYKLLPIVQTQTKIKFIFVGLDNITKIRDTNLQKLDTREFQTYPKVMPSKTLVEPEIVGWMGYISPYTEKGEDDEGNPRFINSAKIITTGDPKIFTPNIEPWGKKGQDYATLFIQECFASTENVSFPKNSGPFDLCQTEYIKYERHNVDLPTISQGRRWFKNKYFDNITREEIDIGDTVQTPEGYGTVINYTQENVQVKIKNTVETFNKIDVKRKNFQRRGLFALYNNGLIKKITTNIKDNTKASIVRKTYSSSVILDWNPFDPFYFDFHKELFDFRSDIDANLYIKKSKKEWIPSQNKMYNQLVKNKNYSSRPDFIKNEIAARIVYFQNTNRNNIAQLLINNTKGVTKRVNAILRKEGIHEQPLLDGSGRIGKKESNIRKTFSQIEKKKSFGGRMPWQESKFRRKKMNQYIRQLYGKTVDAKGQTIEVIRYNPDKQFRLEMKIFKISRLGNPLNENLFLFAPTFLQMIRQEDKFPLWKKKFKQQYLDGKAKWYSVTDVNQSLTMTMGKIFTGSWQKDTQQITEDWVKYTTKRFKPRQLTITAEDHNEYVQGIAQRKKQKAKDATIMAFYGSFYPKKLQAANVFPRIQNYIEKFNMSFLRFKPTFLFPSGGDDVSKYIPQIKAMNWINVTVDNDGDFLVKFDVKPIISKLDVWELLGNFINAMSYTKSPTSKKVGSIYKKWHRNSDKEIIVTKKVFNANYKKLIKSITQEKYPHAIKKVGRERIFKWITAYDDQIVYVVKEEPPMSEKEEEQLGIYANILGSYIQNKGKSAASLQADIDYLKKFKLTKFSIAKGINFALLNFINLQIKKKSEFKKVLTAQNQTWNNQQDLNVNMLSAIFLIYANILRLSPSDNNLLSLITEAIIGDESVFSEKLEIEEDEATELNIEYNYLQNIEFPITIDSVENSAFSMLYLINQHTLPIMSTSFTEAMEIEEKKK